MRRVVSLEPGATNTKMARKSKREDETVAVEALEPRPPNPARM